MWNFIGCGLGLGVGLGDFGFQFWGGAWIAGWQLMPGGFYLPLLVVAFLGLAFVKRQGGFSYLKKNIP